MHSMKTLAPLAPLTPLAPLASSAAASSPKPHAKAVPAVTVAVVRPSSARVRAAAKLPPGAALAAPSTIALLQAHTLTSAVHTEIERLILSGELAPGAKLTEAMLAERLGVSRGPIREALLVLEEAGLARLEKNRGAFVRSIPLDEAMEIYDLRAMVDESAGRQLAECITPERLKELRSMVEQMERLVKEGHKTSASDPYHLLNLAFHDRIVEFVGNRKLTGLYRRLVKELSLFRRVNLADGQQIPVSVQEHRAILKAIAAGDADGAGRAMVAHVLQSKQRTLDNSLPHPVSPAVAAGRSDTAPASGARKPRHA